MNPATLKSFDRLLSRMERRANRPVRRLTASPFVLGFGLVLADLLLTRLVPAVWENTLPGGLEQAATLRGWPAILWRAAVFCHWRQGQVQAGIGAVAALALVLGYRYRPVRFFVWLLAAGVIVLNAAIIALTLRTGLAASALNLGIE